MALMRAEGILTDENEEILTTLAEINYGNGK